MPANFIKFVQKSVFKSLTQRGQNGKVNSFLDIDVPYRWDTGVLTLKVSHCFITICNGSFSKLY